MEQFGQMEHGEGAEYLPIALECRTRICDNGYRPKQTVNADFNTVSVFIRKKDFVIVITAAF